MDCNRTYVRINTVEYCKSYKGISNVLNSTCRLVLVDRYTFKSLFHGSLEFVESQKKENEKM